MGKSLMEANQCQNSFLLKRMPTQGCVSVRDSGVFRYVFASNGKNEESRMSVFNGQVQRCTQEDEYRSIE